MHSFVIDNANGVLAAADAARQRTSNVSSEDIALDGAHSASHRWVAVHLVAVFGRAVGENKLFLIQDIVLATQALAFDSNVHTYIVLV